MNKKISKILALIITTTLFMPMAAVAQSNFSLENTQKLEIKNEFKKDIQDAQIDKMMINETQGSSTETNGQAASSGSVQSSLEQVFSIQDKDFNLDTVVGDKNKNLLNNLPKAKDENTFSDLYGSVAKLMLAVATIGIFVALFVAGAIMAINQGDENATKTAKDIVKYVIIGVIIIAAAYGIVTGITRLKPF